MIRRMRGASMVEYVVLVVLLIALVGVPLLGVSLTISNTLNHVNANIGR